MLPETNGQAGASPPAVLLQLVAYDATTQRGQLSITHTLPGGWHQAVQLLIDAQKAALEKAIEEACAAQIMAQNRRIVSPWQEG